MPHTPISATPYEVLGVAPSADMDELRRAYRRMLRATHPDTGGIAVDFHAVQWAWQRVGTPEERAAYDGARPSVSSSRVPSWAPVAPTKVRGTRPAATEYGDAGGWQRENYLRLLGEWKGAPIDDPYDTLLVRSAPPEVRHVLAKALAEESDGHALSALGIGFTLWHDVAGPTVSHDSTDVPTGQKIDHVVLGASGLFAVSSEDLPGPIRLRGGEPLAAALTPGARPLHSLALLARSVARLCSVRFTAAVMVLPDDSSWEPVTLVGSARGIPTILVWRSRLPGLMRSGFGATPFRGGAEVFDIRTRLRAGVRLL